MNYIKGKFRQTIFLGDNGYTVGLFKVYDTNDVDMEDFIKKTITFTGYFDTLNDIDNYTFYGKLIYHDRYGYQYNVENYEKTIPTEKDSIIEFLTSPLIKGCGEKTANRIVDILGTDAILKIKNNINNLDLIPKLTDKKKSSIYNSILKYYSSNEIIIELKTLGFSIKEALKLISIYGSSIKNIVNDNIYSLIDDIDFNTLDKIYLSMYNKTTDLRILACIIESMKRLTFINGDTYSFKDDILDFLYKEFNISISDDKYFNILSNDLKIKIEDNKYYLMNYYLDEESIINNLYDISKNKVYDEYNIDRVINKVEKELKLNYNIEQKEAIKSVFYNNIVIITGGPGTGKTTIINGILNTYQKVFKYSKDKMNLITALLAPTGRASKRMSQITDYKACTIHRYLKWNKETNSFGINEYNKNKEELIIVDETSMIDLELFSSLLKGIRNNVKLVLVGDEHQLPSVSIGLILNDLIDSKLFKHINLKNIYRQSKNSYIPILANEVKENKLTTFLDKKDDYNFIECNKDDVKNIIITIVKKLIEKKYNINDIQVLAPMYKGECGIDNLNYILENIFNNKDNDKVLYGDIIYKVGDKVINLVNDIDKSIYNGDIGYIVEINKDSKLDYLIVDFDNNIVSFKKDELGMLKHAYVISIHKAQGSEFDHVIIPIVKSYNRMLYNKLIYTAISRAKKSLLLVGDKDAFIYSVNNNYSSLRKSNLKNKLLNKFNN